MKYAYSMAACAAMGTLALANTAFEPSKVEGHFVEQFTSDLSSSRWSPSRATKDEVAGEVFSYVGKWAVEEPEVFPGIEGDKALVIKSKAAHHAISVPFESSYNPNSKTTVVSYEVKLQKGLECGGAYIKLLEDSADGIQAEEFSDKTPYSIMFGPDRCGPTSKVHFIVRHKNPVTGEVEEKHLMSPPAPKITKTSALYTLIIHGDDNTYEIKVNNESQKKGSLLEDFSPPFSPPEEIDDATDEKPADWVEQPKIADPDAVKPSDWDEEAPATILDLSEERPASWLANEPLTIPDPTAEKPEEWSDEDDGDYLFPEVPNPACAAPGVAGCGPWTPPMIPNPAYKGPWFAPLIDNPAYKGVWKPKKIANPAYFEVDPAALFAPIGGIGIELWSMTEDIAFDNIFVGSDEKDAALFIQETFVVKKALEDKAEESAKPVVEDKVADAVAPELAVDPVGFATYHAQKFLDHAKTDPVGALKAKPETAGALAAAFATLFTILTLLLSLLTPKAKPAVPKKSAAVVAKKTDAVTADVAGAEDISEAPLAEKKVVVEEKLTGVKTRASKAKVDAE